MFSFTVSDSLQKMEMEIPKSKKKTLIYRLLFSIFFFTKQKYAGVLILVCKYFLSWTQWENPSVQLSNYARIPLFSPPNTNITLVHHSKRFWMGWNWGKYCTGLLSWIFWKGILKMRLMTDTHGLREGYIYCRGRITRKRDEKGYSCMRKYVIGNHDAMELISPKLKNEISRRLSNSIHYYINTH